MVDGGSRQKSIQIFSGAQTAGTGVLLPLQGTSTLVTLLMKIYHHSLTLFTSMARD